MKFLKALTKWQFWTSLLLMGVACFGLYYFIFNMWLESYTNHNQAIEIPDLSKLDVHQAMKTLDELDLTYEIDSVRYDSTQKPFSVLDFYPVKGFKVKEGRKIFIKSNPSGWRPTNLPDIIGKSKRLAFTQLKLSGLEVGDTIYEPDLAKDAVLRVMYRGKQIGKETELPRFAKVDLVLGKGLEYGVSTPSLVGLSLEGARSSILANRFDVGMLNVDGAVSDSSTLKVYYQYPLPGDNYDQGLPVDLWLTSRDLSQLQAKIKELDRQYRNFGENDSLASKTYEQELKLKTKEVPVTPQEQQPKEINKDKPKGVEFD